MTHYNKVCYKNAYLVIFCQIYLDLKVDIFGKPIIIHFNYYYGAYSNVKWNSINIVHVFLGGICNLTSNLN